MAHLPVKNKQGVILITGGTRGIGFGIAAALASEGYNLILGYNSNKIRANESKQKLIEFNKNHKNLKIMTCGGDLTLDTTLSHYFDIIKNEFDNKLIGVVYNAGMYPGTTVSSDEAVNQTMESHLNKPVVPGSLNIKLNTSNKDQDRIRKDDIDLMQYYIELYGKSFLKLLEKCGPLMRWRKDIGGGTIIYISSPGVEGTRAPSATYVLNGCGKSIGGYLVRQYAKYYAKDNITVNTIIPGVIDTEAWEMVNKNAGYNFKDEVVKRSTPMNRAGKPIEIGDLVAFLFSDKARYITGISMRVDGGLAIGKL